MTVSPGLIFMPRGNGKAQGTFRSSPTHSRYSSAPCSRQILPPFFAMRRYAPSLDLETCITKPSTYLAMTLPWSLGLGQTDSRQLSAVAAFGQRFYFC